MLESLAAKISAFAIGALLIFGGGVWTGYRIELGVVNGLKAADAKADLAAAQALTADISGRIDISNIWGSNDASAQPLIVEHYRVITKEIPAHVSDTANCITYGLVRVLNAAARNEAIAVPDSASESDDTCAPVSWRDFAADITDDYKTGYQNSKQLNDLVGWVAAQEAHNDSPAQPVNSP